MFFRELLLGRFLRGSRNRSFGILSVVGVPIFSLIAFNATDANVFFNKKDIKDLGVDLNHPESNFKGEIVIYQAKDGKTSLEVKLKEETVWLNINQMTELFDRDKSVISRHIRNVFKEGELEEQATVANFATVQTEGGRTVERNIEYYNLDVIISVGYRVKSQRGTQFRIWATQVLKNHILKGYTLNEKRLREQNTRLIELQKTIELRPHYQGDRESD